MVDVHFKPAESIEEIEQIHRLNHRIFAEEVMPQDQGVTSRAALEA